MFKSVVLAAVLQAAVVAGSNLCNANYETYQQICGQATGNFQLLGSLCFDAGSDNVAKKSTVTFELTFSNVGTILPIDDLNQYYVLFFDDQSDSFSAINRITDDGDFQTCTEREEHSKPICSSNNASSCTYGWHVVGAKNKTDAGDLTTYTKSITVSENYAREWYFVLSACGISNAIKLHSYTMFSDNAVECSQIYTSSDAGYIAAVVILTLAMAVLGVVSFIFWKRTKIPELLSMDDTGYNEL